MRRVRIFISSPGDVDPERELAARVIDQLGIEYGDWLRVETVDWHKVPLPASQTFQDSIPSTEFMDIVIVILWSRLGSPLPDTYRREDGSTYKSGTEYEFECALDAFERTAAPQVLVYRKVASPSFERGEYEDPERMQCRLADLQAVTDFFQSNFRGEDGTFTRAVNEFESLDEFETRLTPQLSDLLRAIKPPPEIEIDEGPLGGTWLKGSPYRGLEEFRLEDSEVFFGRSKAVSEVYRALQENSLQGRRSLFVLGTSGSGKSSMLQAGLAPAVLRPETFPGITHWRYLSVRPSSLGADPFPGLAKALVEPGVLPELLDEYSTVEMLTEALREGSSDAAHVIRNGLSRAEASETSSTQESNKSRCGLLLVLDQFEEFFSVQTTVPEGGKAFLGLLRALAFQPGGRVWVTGTMRSDYYDTASRYVDLMALMGGHGHYYLLPPSASELRQIILWPARAASVTFETCRETRRSLDMVLCDEAIEHPECLPILEFVLQELYERGKETRELTFADYDALNGISGAIARTAEELFSELGADARAAFKHVLLPIVRISEEEGLVGRQKAPYSRWNDRPDCQMLIDAFVAHRLFVKDRAIDGEVSITVAHEAVLREWETASKIIRENQHLLKMHDRLAKQNAIWLHQDRSDSYLLSPGLAIEEGRELLRLYQEGLSEDERHFIQVSEASIRSAHRTRRRDRIVRATFWVMFLITAVAAVAYSQVVIERSEKENAKAETRRQSNALLQLGALTFELPQRFEYMQSARAVVVEFLEKMEPEILKGFADIGSATESRVARARFYRATGEAEITLRNFEKAQARTREALSVLAESDESEGDTPREILFELAANWRVLAFATAPMDSQTAELHLKNARDYAMQFLQQLGPDEPLEGLQSLYQRGRISSEWGRLLYDRGIALLNEDSGRREEAVALFKQALVHLEHAESLLKNSGTESMDEWEARFGTVRDVEALFSDLIELQILSIERIGNLHLKMGELSENDEASTSLTLAYNYYKQEQGLIKRQQTEREGYRESVQWLYDSGVCSQKLGETALLLKNMDDAIDGLKDSLGYLEQLVQREPFSPLYLDALANSHAFMRVGYEDLATNESGMDSKDRYRKLLVGAANAEIEIRRRWLKLLIDDAQDDAHARGSYSDTLWNCAESLEKTQTASATTEAMFLASLGELRRAARTAREEAIAIGVEAPPHFDAQIAKMEEALKERDIAIPPANVEIECIADIIWEDTEL